MAQPNQPLKTSLSLGYRCRAIHLNLSFIWNTHHCPEISLMERWWHNVVGRYATELYTYKQLKWYILGAMYFTTIK